MKRTLNLATIVALLATAVVVAAGCTNPKPPTERIVNLDSLPNLYEAGRDTLFTTCSTTDFRWMDCDQVFHPAKKFVPSGLVSFSSQGMRFDLREKIGLSEGEELVIREKRKVSTSPQVPQHPAPTAPIKKTEPVNKEISTDGGNFFLDHFWDILKWLLMLLAIAWFTFAFLLPTYYDFLQYRRARRSQTPPTTGDRSGTDERRNNTTIIHNSHIEHHHVAQEPMRVAYKGEGEHAMTFEVHGMFSLPLQVKVAKGNEPPTTVTFGPPEAKERTS